MCEVSYIPEAWYFSVPAYKYRLEFGQFIAVLATDVILITING